MRSRNGVTLIGLVITIIVLLILAGVSIAAVTSDNGVFTKAIKSEIEYTKAHAINGELVKAADKTIEKSEDISSIFNEKVLLGLLTGETESEDFDMKCLTVEPTSELVKTVSEKDEISTVYIINPTKLSSKLVNCGKGKKLSDNDVFTLEVILEEVTPEGNDAEPYKKSTGKFKLKYYDADGKEDVIDELTLYATNKS